MSYTWAFIKNLCSNAHYQARETTVPVLDRQSGVPIRIHGVVPEECRSSLAHLAGPLNGRTQPSLGFAAPDIQKLYDELIVHWTEPFTEPQVEALNP